MNLTKRSAECYLLRERKNYLKEVGRMQNKDTTPVVAQASIQRSARERVGLAVSGTNASEAVSTIMAAEAAGVRQTWMIQTPPTPDTLTIFAAASVLTTSVRLGTAIVPTYPRHP
jgi:alkanesulfonate monooxygenase SsuD/methylene tetrahydromethanopterin reductase-like flavin-dependent oxidoreductase (luciferase family)